MARCVFFLEGHRDAVFFEEIVCNGSSRRTRRIVAKELSKYARGDNDEVLLTDCGGVPNIYNVIKLSMRELLGAGNPSALYAIGDSDRVSFGRLTGELDRYLKTHCKAHNVKPRLILDARGGLVTLRDMASEITLPLRLMLVNRSLEARLFMKLKERYPRDVIHDEEKMIQLVSTKHFGGDDDLLFSKAAVWLKNEPWLVEIRKCVMNELN